MYNFRLSTKHTKVDYRLILSPRNKCKRTNKVHYMHMGKVDSLNNNVATIVTSQMDKFILVVKVSYLNGAAALSLKVSVLVMQLFFRKRMTLAISTCGTGMS